MNRAVITIAITLGALTLPLQAAAAGRSVVTYSAGHLHQQQWDWQRHREHRREAIPHRHSYNHRVIKTNHRAVKQRLAADRLNHRRYHSNHLSNPREITIHYYAPGNGRYYDRDRRHHHRQNTDYQEWLSVVTLLDNIYSDQP